MTMTRASRRFVCRLMFGVLVFAQLAIASYACPALSGVTQPVLMMAMGGEATMPDRGTAASVTVLSDMSATSDMAAMTGCDQIDDDAANLCAEHCRFGQASADHASAQTVPAALLTALYTLPLQPQPLGHGWISGDLTFKHVAASPPHTILHCCFRI